MYLHNKRFTLKADPSCSIQPQNADGKLLNIVEVLESHGYPLATLRKKLVKTRKTENPGSHPQSQPLWLDNDAVIHALYNWVKQTSIKLTGDKLEKITPG